VDPPRKTGGGGGGGGGGQHAGAGWPGTVAGSELSYLGLPSPYLEAIRNIREQEIQVMHKYRAGHDLRYSPWVVHSFGSSCQNLKKSMLVR